MTPDRTGLAFALGLALAVAEPALAAPPQINSISPSGAQRGVETELTVKGSNLGDNPRLVAPFRHRAAGSASAGSDASNWKFNLTVDGETAVGVYPVRVQTDDGLSNPFLFSVGQLPQVVEKEDNSTVETAQAFTAPAVIEGQAQGNDVDYFRFAGRKGQKIVIDAQCARIGSGVDPSIRLTTASRAYVGSADDTPGLLTDARLFAVLPEDTDYVIELSDSRYQGAGRPVYRLVVGAVPAAEEVYPIGGRVGETVGLELRGGTLEGERVVAARLEVSAGVSLARLRATEPGASAGLDVESLPPVVVGSLPELREPSDPNAGPVRAAVPVVLNGRIDPAGDEDRFTLAVTPGQKLRIAVEAADRGSALDGVLQVLGAKEAVLVTADDTTTPPNPKAANNKNLAIVSPDPSLDFAVPSGVSEVTLALRDLESRGGTGFPYRIVVTPADQGFTLALNDTQVSIPKGGTAAVAVTVTRKGYNGPITLKVVNLPAGLTVRPGQIAEGQTAGLFTVSAAADSALDAVTLDVVGEGQGANGPFVVKADKAVVFAQQSTLPTNTLTLVGLAAAPSKPQGVALETPAESIEVAHGFGATVAVKAVRDKDANGELAVSLLTPPPGLAVPSAKIGEKDAEGTVTVNTAAESPLGQVTVVLVGKGKVAGSDRTITAPVLTLNVVKPATVELATTAVEVKPGASAEVKGKVVRKGAFKEAVTVKLDKLPAGLKAEPVKVEPDATEFTATITADDKAAAASATANVALAFQVNKKDYPAPTATLSVKVLPAK
jgi:hypothetical protein